MLDGEIASIYGAIVKEAREMVSQTVSDQDLTGSVNYASIYAQSSDESDRFSEELGQNGEVADAQPTGSYFLLKKPLTTTVGNITICRVRKSDTEHRERGYVDFEAVDYEAFKENYLPRPYFSLIQNVHGIELVELRVLGHNVRAYFPDSFY